MHFLKPDACSAVCDVAKHFVVIFDHHFKAVYTHGLQTCKQQRHPNNKPLNESFMLHLKDTMLLTKLVVFFRQEGPAHDEVFCHFVAAVKQQLERSLLQS